VLADLALESEAATVFAMRLARCFDQAGDPAQALLARILTPAGKYWICKRGPAFGAEAMEVIGGSGYVEDSPLARLYRELPVNSIWEGSGNVMCLDLLRAFGKTPAAREVLAAELALAGNADTFYVAYKTTLLAELAEAQADEAGARVLAERVVLAVQAGLLLRHAPDLRVVGVHRVAPDARARAALSAACRPAWIAPPSWRARCQWTAAHLTGIMRHTHAKQTNIYMKQDPRFPNLFITDHPLIQHKLSHMRDKSTSTRTFRELLKEITLLMGYEITRDLPLTTREIETPLQTINAPVIAGKKLAVVPILRAGIGMSDGLLNLVPSARVGHIGVFRDPETHQPVEYLVRLPDLVDRIFHPVRPDGGDRQFGGARGRCAEEPWRQR
jgi:hypothetical protein